MNMKANRHSSRVARVLMGTAFAAAILLPMAGGCLKAQDKPAPKPAESDARYQKGVDLMQAGKLAEAEAAFRDAVALNPDNTRALMGQVEVMVAEKKPQEALDLLQDQVAKYPERIDLRMALGNAAVRMGKYDVGIATFQEVLPKLDKDAKARADVYLRIGESYRRKGDTASAIASLRQAQQILPDDIVIGGTLALVQDQAGQSEEAEKQYRAVLKLDPDNGLAMNNLAYLLADNGGDLDEALQLAQRARAARQDLPAISDTLGWIYLKKGMTDAAVGMFDGLVQKEPGNPTFHYHLAMALLAKGDKFAATQQLTAALQSNPSNEESKKIKEALEKSAQ